MTFDFDEFMVCFICKRTEEELRNSSLQEIEDIDNAISIIKGKIAIATASSNTIDSESIDKDSNNCMGETGKYCQNCDSFESVDGKKHFWCKMYKKTFKLPKNKIVKQLKREIDVLETKHKELEGQNLKVVESEYNNFNDRYIKIMLTYLSNFSKQNQHSSIYISKNCNTLLDEIIDNKISSRMADIIEDVKNEIEEDNNEDET